MDITRWKNISMLFVLVWFLAGCTTMRVYVFPSNEPEKSLSNIIQENLQDLTQIQPYSPRMKPGDSFLLTLLPGIPLPEEELKFSSLSGTDLSGDLKSIDQAYRFSKLVNKVLVSGPDYNPTGIELGNLYSEILKQIPANELPSDDFRDIDILKMNSATYNDYFFLTTVIPVEDAGKNWVDHDRIYNIMESIDISEEDQSLPFAGNFTSYRFAASLKRLNLQRPWFHEDLARKSDAINSHYKPQFSIITGLILIKNLDVNIYPAANKLVMIPQKSKRSALDKVDPTSSMSAEGPLIIGLICVLL